jgi:hypothetical protein
MFARLKAAKTFRSGTMMLRQVRGGGSAACGVNRSMLGHWCYNAWLVGKWQQKGVSRVAP